MNMELKSYIYGIYKGCIPYWFFKENFGEYEQGKANGILCSIKDRKGQNKLIFDDLLRN